MRTKNNTIAVLLVSLLVSINASAFKQATGWQLFESKKIGLKINFPGAPVENKQTVNSAVGPLDMDMFQLDVSTDTASSNLMYMVNYTKYPDSLNINNQDKIDVFFNGSINGMVTNTKGKLLSQKKGIYKDYPCREIRVDLQGQAIITAKLILIKNKYYMLMVFTSSGKEPNTDTEKFFSSFESE